MRDVSSISVNNEEESEKDNVEYPNKPADDDVSEIEDSQENIAGMFPKPDISIPTNKISIIFKLVISYIWYIWDLRLLYML